MQVTFKATVVRVYFLDKKLLEAWTTSQLPNNFKRLYHFPQYPLCPSLHSFPYTIEVFLFSFYINISVITFYDNENENNFCTLLVFLYSIFLVPLYLAGNWKSAVYYTSLGKDCRLQGCEEDLVVIISFECYRYITGLV